MTEYDERRKCEACGEVKAGSEFSGENGRCKQCVADWTEFRRGIDERLDAHRPSRAGVTETDWREGDYAWARNHMPNEAMLVRNIAKREVDQREIVATRRGNRLLREWFDAPQTVLTIDDVGFLPVRIGDQHVRLDKTSVHDGRQFVEEESARLGKTYDSGMRTVAAMEYLVDLAAKEGVTMIAQLGSVTSPGEKATG